MEFHEAQAIFNKYIMPSVKPSIRRVMTIPWQVHFIEKFMPLSNEGSMTTIADMMALEGLIEQTDMSVMPPD